VVAGALLGDADPLADLAPGRARLDARANRDGELARDLVAAAPVMLQRRVEPGEFSLGTGGAYDAGTRSCRQTWLVDID
jgi:hypothetical protein